MHVITPADAAARCEQEGMTATAGFWSDHQELMARLQVGDEFWADKVASLKRQGGHLEAAAICRRARPVPGAYRELLICLRRLLKDSDRKEDLRREIYATAVEATVLHRERHVEYMVEGRQVGCPGFNVAAILFEEFQRQPIEIRYDEVGLEHVEWLNKTDRSRFIKAWGTPAAHRDPFDLFRPDWDRAVAAWVAGEADRRRESRESWPRLVETPAPVEASQAVETSRPKKRWWDPLRLFG